MTHLDLPGSTDLLGGERIVPLAGAFNFRDLGGYETADRRRVRSGVLFRSGGLTDLTGADLVTMAEIGLRTVVDLRSAAEVAHGIFPIEAHPVEYHHLSIIDQTWDPAMARLEGVTTTSFLHGAYTAMLTEGADRFASAFRLLAAPGTFPAVFHCAAGKDRTGLLAMLLLGSLGVDDDTVVADYVLTQDVMPAFLARLELEDSERGAAVRSHPTAFFQADGPALRLVLADLEQTHGGVREYVRSIGVADDVIDALAAELLEAP